MTTPNKTEVPESAVGCLIALIVGVGMAGFVAGYFSGRADVKQEAVKNHAAIWEPDEYGNTHIRWLDSTQSDSGESNGNKSSSGPSPENPHP